MIITPKLRGDVSCLGGNECYPLAFGLPAVLMIAALSIFVLGRSSYVIVIPSRNVLWDTCCATFSAVRLRYARWRDGRKSAILFTLFAVSFAWEKRNLYG